MQRYRHEGELIEHPDGEWVKWDDVGHLCSELDRVELELAELYDESDATEEDNARLQLQLKEANP